MARRSARFRSWRLAVGSLTLAATATVAIAVALHRPQPQGASPWLAAKGASQQHIEFKGPQFLEDAGGRYVLHTKEGIIFDDHLKTYISGPKAGTTVELGFFEAVGEGSKFKAKYGYVDLGGDYVRGTETPAKPSLDSCEPPGGWGHYN